MALTLLLKDGKLVLDTGSLVVTQNAAGCECCGCGTCYEYVDVVLPAFTDAVSTCCDEIDILSWQIPYVSSTYNPSNPSLECYYEKTTGFTNAGCLISKISVLIYYQIGLNLMDITVRVDGETLFSGLILKIHEFNSGSFECSSGPWTVASSSYTGCATSGTVSVTPGPAL